MDKLKGLHAVNFSLSTQLQQATLNPELTCLAINSQSSFRAILDRPVMCELLGGHFIRIL